MPTPRPIRRAILLPTDRKLVEHIGTEVVCDGRSTVGEAVPLTW
jgi:hypothetical protein